MTRTSIRHNNILIIPIVIDDAFYAGPRVLDVVEVPPQVAVMHDGRVIRLHARVNLIYWPAAGIYHRPSCLVQVVAEFRIAGVHVRWVSVAAV